MNKALEKTILYFRDEYAKNCGGFTHLPSSFIKNCPTCGIKLPTKEEFNIKEKQYEKN